MGSQSSNSKTNKSKINVSQDENSYDYELKTENTVNIRNSKNHSSNGQSETAENTKIIDSNEKKIPYKFEWKEGGTEVQIAGSFLNNWNEKINMKRNINTGFFEIILNISKSVHQFKFIVDKQWVCSPKYTTINEKNNTNNIIDLTNYNPNDTNKDNDESDNSQKNKKKKKKLTKDKTEYNCNYPKITDIDSTPDAPSNYLNSFDLNNQSNQDNLKKYFQKIIKNNISKNIIENNTFKTIMTISHDKLLHLCYSAENTDLNDTFIRTAVTQRNKHKFITLIYYSPK